MAKYTVDQCVKKSDEWYILSLSDAETNCTHDVSVNKVNKKGEAFPDFDKIEEGKQVSGELWTSQTGKNYLFAPKAQGAGRPNMTGMMEKKTASIAQFQDKKAEQIEKAQDRSAWMWAKTNASTLLAGDVSRIQGFNNDEIANKVIDLATKIYNGEPLMPF